MADILDSWVLADNKIVTYRLLSRLLRVKANHAKNLMAQWHSKNPGTHATYVLFGLDRGIEGEVDMARFPNSFSQDASSKSPRMSAKEPPRSRTIRLVSKEDLDKAKSGYRELHSLHIYSVEPARLSDQGLLSNVCNDIKDAIEGQSYQTKEFAEIYGLILNTGVHESEQDHPIKKTSICDPIPIFLKHISKEEDIVTVIKPPDNRQNSREKQVANKETSSLKRNATNSLASAFAKSQKPKARFEPEVSGGLGDKAPSVEDSIDNTCTEDLIKKSANKVAVKNTELHDMMMADDEPQEDVATKEDTMEDTAYWSASDTEMKEAVDLPPSAVHQRARVRRKIKRQVHTTDSKGYMVTKEEWEWISCDEEEDDKPMIPVLARKDSTNSKSIASKIKTAPKKKSNGQAGIANYFAKK